MNFTHKDLELLIKQIGSNKNISLNISLSNEFLLKIIFQNKLIFDEVENPLICKFASQCTMIIKDSINRENNRYRYKLTDIDIDRIYGIDLSPGSYQLTDNDRVFTNTDPKK